MFSKIKLITSLLALSFMMTACTDFLRDKRSEKTKAEDKTIEFEAGEECLKQVPEALNQFFTDEPAAKTLNPSMDCLKKSLETFQKYTRGEVKGSYTAKELQHFLNRYLLKDNQITDDFLVEIMKLKVVVVGGERAILTKTEIQSLYTFMDLLKDQGGALSGHFKLLSFGTDRKKENREELQKSLKSSEAKLLNVLSTLMDKSKIVASRYEFDDLKSFIFELDKFIGENDALKSVIKWLPVVETAKLLFIGEHSKMIVTKEWKASLDWLNKSYFFALKYYYLIQELDLKDVASWSTMLPWTDQFFDLIDSAPMMREKKLLEDKYIDRLIDGVWDLKLFETTLSADLIKQNYRKAIVHLVEGQPAGKGNPSGVIGLKLDHYKILRQEYNVWRLTQMSIIEAYSHQAFMTASHFLSEIQRFDVARAIGSFKVDALERETLVRSWTDWVNLAKKDRPIVLNNKNKVTINYNVKNSAVSFAGLSLTNMVRTWTRFAVRGYGTHQNQHLGDSSITEKRLIHLEEDFREFGRAVGFLDPRQADPAARTFKEGNFFTYHGNGDDWLTFTETFELLNVLMTGGQNIVGEILDDLGTQNCLLNEKDVFGKPIAVTACFKKRLKTEASRYFDNMIWMNKLISNATPQEYDALFNSLMALSRLPMNTNPAKVEYAEIRTLSTVLMYVETLFVVYDKDNDQLLNEQEAVAAFPRFKKFIENMAGHTWFTEDIFMFLVYKGRAPTGTKEVLGFKAERLLGLDKVSKLQLIKVLSVLKDTPEAKK